MGLLPSEPPQKNLETADALPEQGELVPAGQRPSEHRQKNFETAEAVVKLGEVVPVGYLPSEIEQTNLCALRKPPDVASEKMSREKKRKVSLLYKMK